MTVESTHESEAAARALALMVTANGHVDPAELSMLDSLDAYRRVGVSRERFAALAQEGRVVEAEEAVAQLASAARLMLEEPARPARRRRSLPPTPTR